MHTDTTYESLKLATLASIGNHLTTITTITRNTGLLACELGPVLESLQSDRAVICHYHSVPAGSPLWQSAYRDEATQLARHSDGRYIVGACVRRGF